MDDIAPEHLTRIASLVKDCEQYRDELSTDRTKAIEYHDGIMNDTPAEEHQSQVVSRDVRATQKKLMPSIIRTILGNDEIVEYQPMEEGDENGAGQASDYINYVVFAESGGYDAVYDALHDAARLRNGVIKWWYDEKTSVTTSKHSGLQEDSFAELVNGEDTEVLEHDERQEIIEQEGPGGQAYPIPVMVHDVTIRRRETKRMARMAAVPLDEFLIHPDAVDEQDAIVVGQCSKLRKTDLVAMGYEKAKVDQLPMADEEEESARRGDAYEFAGEDGIDPSLQEIDYYELFVRSDMDGDGIAELRRMCFGGKVDSRGLLFDEECDCVQMRSLKIERKPHQWEGVSLSDDTMEIQRIKTVLIRQTLNNLYWQNNPQPIVSARHIEDMSPVMNPRFGLPIIVDDSAASVKDALTYTNIPFFAKESFGMLDYLDEEITDRTGISDMSSGMAPDALQNMTAKASSMMEAAGIGQTEQIVRTLAADLRVVFQGLLRLIIKHQDAPRTVRLRKEWVEFDPRHWNASMDATVNTGLGAGTRERDMMMMQGVIGLQEKLLTSMGPDNVFIKPDNLYNAINKYLEAAGIKGTSQYVTNPDPDEVQQKLDATRNKPSPEMEKAKAQAQIEQAKLQASMQESQARLAMDKQKLEYEQEAARFKAENEANLARLKIETDAQLKREQTVAELNLKREQLAAELELKREQAYVESQMNTNVSDVHMGGEPG